MKKIGLAMLFALVLFTSLPASAADPAKAPDGFRGIKFGTDLSKEREMEKTGRTFESATIWERRGDMLFIEDAPCSAISYSTFNNLFFKAMVRFYTKNSSEGRNIFSLGQALSDIYGEPDRNEISFDNGIYMMKFWNFKNNVTVTFNYLMEEDIVSGFLSYTFLPIEQQRFDYHYR